MSEWKIGCSGFHYKHWKEFFYPKGLPQTKWFQHYCRHFNTLELNVTFYRFPELSFLQNWYEKSPEDFTFSVKAPRLITHYKKFTDTKTLIAEFYHTLQKGLQHKLSVVLFQLPPSYQYTQARLDAIINNLNTVYCNVLEFRHQSWWIPEVYQQLAAHQIIFCGMSHPLLPDDVILNTDNIYYRFHGVPQLYASEYTSDTLVNFYNRIESFNKVKTAYVFFNNDIGGSAINNALFLKGHYEK